MPLVLTLNARKDDSPPPTTTTTTTTGDAQLTYCALTSLPSLRKFHSKFHGSTNEAYGNRDNCETRSSCNLGINWYYFGTAVTEDHFNYHDDVIYHREYAALSLVIVFL